MEAPASRPVGPPEVHDARVLAFSGDRAAVSVAIDTYEGRRLEFAFADASVEAHAPTDMVLYALVQRGGTPRRQFEFVNWDEADPRRLVVTAAAGRWRWGESADWHDL